MATPDPRRRTIDTSALVPIVAADVQPADEAIWTQTDGDGVERHVAAQVEYLVMPPEGREVVLVDGEGHEFPLDRDHPVMAVRGEDWRWWLSSGR
jgi:hypothetical protein